MVPIVQEGEPVLRGMAKPVPQEMFGTPELERMLKDMTDALAAQPDGVALAAPQIALPYRIFVVRYDRMDPHHDPEKKVPADVGIFINPEIVKTSRAREEMQEGCLSVRGIYGTTLRHERATVRAKNERGRAFTRGGSGILAQAFQHEIDHLDGMLFIDHAVEMHEQTREHEHEPE